MNSLKLLDVAMRELKPIQGETANALLARWLSGRLGYMAPLPRMLMAFAKQRGARSLDELRAVDEPNAMYAVRWSNEQAFHVGQPGSPSLKRRPRR